MDTLWEKLEELDEYVYVADMDSYELLYMNQKLRRDCGLTPTEELRGHKCYEVLQGCSAPCAICNNRELKERVFQKMQSYNLKLNKDLFQIDTMSAQGGRRFRVEVALDITDQRAKERTLSKYQNMQLVVNEGLRIALRAPTPDQTIEILLEYLGKALKGQRTYIFERNGQSGGCNTYEWTAAGAIPNKSSQTVLSDQICECLYRDFRENKVEVIPDIEELKEAKYPLYEKLKEKKIHSLVIVPLYDNGEVVAFYGVDNPPEENLEYVSGTLQIMGHFMVSALKRRDLVQKLEEMSYRDQQTKLGNRYAMQAYLEKLDERKSVGVVYGDVTGLKQINDTKGHAAGDMLLFRASESMRKVFGDYGLFRMGGDELVAICPGVAEKQLRQEVQRLLEILRENNVIMAAGISWRPDGRQPIEGLLAEAEAQMYESKRNYYLSTGQESR